MDRSERIRRAAGSGAILGGVLGYPTAGIPGVAAGALGGAGFGAGAIGIGDLLLGLPSEEDNIGQDTARGALGGGALGVLGGVALADKGKILKYLLSKGVSRQAAMKLLIGAATGGSLGATAGGVTGFAQTRRPDDY